TFWTAGSKRPMRTARMAMTTSSSISVNARRGECGREGMEHLAEGGDGRDGVLAIIVGKGQARQAFAVWGSGLSWEGEAPAEPAPQARPEPRPPNLGHHPVWGAHRSA